MFMLFRKPAAAVILSGRNASSRQRGVLTVPRRLLLSLVAVLALGSPAVPLFAATRTWTGTTSGTWSDPSNWGGTAPSAGDDLVFSSSNNAASLNNDFPANTAFHSLTFNAANASFTLAGNAIDIGAGGITVTGGASAFMSVPLTLTASQTWTNDATGSFSVNAAVDLGSNTLSLTGFGGDIFFDGTISGTGGINMTGLSLFVDFASTSNVNYTGATMVSSGAVAELDRGGSIPTQFTIGSGGTLTAGLGISPLLSNTLAINSGGAYKVTIAGGGVGQYTEVGAQAGVTLAGNLVLAQSNVIPAGSVLGILAGTITGTFAGKPDGAVVSSAVQAYLIHYTPSQVTLTALAGSAAPPSLSKAFGTSAVPVGGTTSLTFTVNNPNSGNSLSGVGFNDPLPSGVAVATPNNLSGSCGGGTITGTAGSNSISLAGATLAAGSMCTFSVDVTATSAGAQNNQTTAVTSTEGGNGNQATATLNVFAPPTISKAFGASAIPSGATTTLTFTLGNPLSNPGPLTNVNFIDSLPAGMTVATPNGASTNCMGGIWSATAGGSSLSLNGAAISAGSTCTAVANVTSNVPGTANNTSGAVGSTENSAGSTASASLVVLAPGTTAPPAISKAFGAAQIPFDATTSLTFTIKNPNSGTALTNVGFNDPLPSGLIVAMTPGLTGSCGGGTITAAAGTGSVSLSGATLAAGATCTFSLNVTGNTEGQQDNQTTSVTST